MSEKIISIDIGFGDTKMVTAEGKKIKFPSAIAPVSMNDDLFREKDSYEFQGRNYTVGRSALLSKNCFSTRDREFLLKYAPLLIRHAISYLSERPTVVATGLPLTVYLDRQYRERFVKNLQKFVIDGQIYEFEVQVFAQGQGIFCDYALSNDGLPCKEKLNETVLVIDIGFNTIDVLCVVEGFPTREGSTTLEGDGVSKICEKLSACIQETYSFTLREQAVKEILAQKKLKLYGAEKDISLTANEIVSEYTEWLFQEIYSRWDNFLKRADRLIIAGGGAYYIEEFLPEKYKGFVYIPEDKEFSNARGYLKFLKAKNRQEKGCEAQEDCDI